MLSNDLLYKISKYIDHSENAKLYSAIHSRDNIIRKINEVKEKLDAWLLNRVDISTLKAKNIIRKNDVVLNLFYKKYKIERHLYYLMLQRCNRGHATISFSKFEIDTNLADIAKKLDYELKKIRLKNLLSEK